MNDLIPGQIDQQMFAENIPTDGRKPFRQFVDDKLIPYGGMALGVPLAAGKAVGNLLSNNDLGGKQIKII